MAKDAALRTCLVWLAVGIAVVGLTTHSLKKMMVTYVVGLLAISGVLLPDWDYFDRDFSRWTTPVSGEERAAAAASSAGGARAGLTWLRTHPLRLVLYATVYATALYKWWTYVSS